MDTKKPLEALLLTIDADGLAGSSGLGNELGMAGALWLDRPYCQLGRLCSGGLATFALPGSRLIIWLPFGCHAPIQPGCCLLQRAHTALRSMLAL